MTAEILTRGNASNTTYVETTVDSDMNSGIYDGYYCINIKPFKCENCKTLICYAVVGPHLIVVWPDKDDNDLLQVAEALMKDEFDRYDPHIVTYHELFGPCVTWDKAKENGWIEENFLES